MPKEQQCVLIIGGDYGSKAKYHLEGLALSDMYAICLVKINSRHSTMPTIIQCRPAIGIDCNTIIHAMGRSKVDPVVAVTNVWGKWAQYGFVIVPVADGSTRSDKSGGDDGTGELR